MREGAPAPAHHWGIDREGKSPEFYGSRIKLCLRSLNIPKPTSQPQSSFSDDAFSLPPNVTEETFKFLAGPETLNAVDCFNRKEWGKSSKQ